MSFIPTRHLRALRVVAAAAAAGACTFALAPAVTSADFTQAECTGTGIFARGASFQTSAVASFNTTFKTTDPGCGSAGPTVGYDPAGSGAGRRALGAKGTDNPLQVRDITIRLGASDEPPTPGERDQIEKGQLTDDGTADLTTADNDKVHVVPVAIGVVVVMVNLPDSCTNNGTDLFTGTDPNSAANQTGRPKIPNLLLEQIWAGEVTTWGAAITGLTGPADTCLNAPIKRVVRKDSSGTTYAFKQYLANVNTARSWGALANQAWPNDTGGTAITRGDDNGNGSLRAKLLATEGGIGYGDLATARGASAAFAMANTTAPAEPDDKFWLPIQRRTTTDYDDPQDDALGFLLTSSTASATVNNRGSNCKTSTVSGVPTSTLGDWFPVDATYTATSYAICALTYQLAFDDMSNVYCNSDAEQRNARTVKDFITRGVLSDAAQTALEVADYGPLPKAPATPDLLAIARTGAGQIGWKKAGPGRPCTTSSTTTPPPTTTTPTTTTPTNTTPTTVPPPTAPSNVFTITSTRVAGVNIKMTIRTPGAGVLSVVPSTIRTKIKGKRKRFSLAKDVIAVSGAGDQRATIKISPALLKALRTRALRLTLKVTFTPSGGTAASKTVVVNLKKKKK